MGKNKDRQKKTKEKRFTKAAIKKDFKKNYFAYLLIIPVLLWYIIFCYGPMWGISIGFKDFKPLLGFSKSKWVGLKYFKEFFTGPYFFRTVKNTFLLNIWGLVFGFTAPIILSLFLNEVRNKHFKKVVQTITYMPHFISIVVICGMIHLFTQSGGIITQVVDFITGTEHSSLLGFAGMFRPIYTFSGIWQNIGWDSIIYLSAMSSIDPGLYEAAEMDGCGKLKKMWHITLPGIRGTIGLLFIMGVGGLLSSGVEQIWLLRTPGNMSLADTLDVYVLRIGIQGGQFGYATAIGLIQGLVGLVLVVVSNKICKKLTEVGLW